MTGAEEQGPEDVPVTARSIISGPVIYSRSFAGKIYLPDLFVDIFATVTGRNVEEVPRIIDLCGELGVNWFMACNFIPAGRGKEMIKEDLSPEQSRGRSWWSSCTGATTAPRSRC